MIGDEQISESATTELTVITVEKALGFPVGILNARSLFIDEKKCVGCIVE